MAKQPRRRCKICREWFHPRFSNEWWCSPEHGAEYGLMLREKEKLKREQQRKKEAQQERRSLKIRKAALKPLKHWEDVTQRVVNDYIRERDKDEPCISCGTWETVQWEAGHFRSRGSASHLRYHEENIHKQCHHCNVHLSGNQQQYRINLIRKIGTQRVEALENNNTPCRYTTEELKSIRTRYSALRRALQKKLEAA